MVVITSIKSYQSSFYPVMLGSLPKLTTRMNMADYVSHVSLSAPPLTSSGISYQYSTKRHYIF